MAPVGCLSRKFIHNTSTKVILRKVDKETFDLQENPETY